VTQALHLANGDTVNAKLRDASSIASKIASSDRPVEQWLDEAYLAAFSRRPTPAEKDAVVRTLAESREDRRLAIEDVLWSLISSREFIFNH
jgi:hypothetical protein